MNARPRWIRVLLLAAGVLAATALPSAPARPWAEDGQTSDAPPPVAVPAYRQASHVGVLRVEGVIDRLTLYSLERRIARAKKEGVGAIVLDLDTPGGRADAALDISHLIKTDAPANTVAWVNPNAYSAGTIIALACREIVLAPFSTFGDAAPIYGIPILGLKQMAAPERAKVEAPILSEVIDSARRNHYDENLVRSFVSVGIELWLIEHVDTGERVFVDRNEYERVFGEGPPEQMPPSATQVVLQERTVTPMINKFLAEEAGEEEVIDPAQIERDIQFAQSLPPTRDALTEADRGRWRLLTQVVTEDQLLTLKPSEAKAYGLAVMEIANDEELKRFFGAQKLTRYGETWSEQLVRLLVSWPVRALLIVVFLISLFVEMAMPGVGVFGAAALVALLMLIGAPYLVGMAEWWEILMIVGGLVLILVELFVIPGVGVAGFVGVVALLVGLIGTFVSRDLTTTGGQNELWTGVLTTLTAFFAAGVGMWLISRQIHSLPVLNRIILRAELGSDVTSPAAAIGATAADRRALEVGDVGTAETDLRPAGRVNFEGRLVDVKSVGPFIDKGAPVRVVSVGRFVIEVEEADA